MMTNRISTGTGGRLPEIIFGAALLAILGSLLLFYLVDLRNLWGMGSFVNRLFFLHWWRDEGPIEWLQWACLASAALLGAFIAGRIHGHDQRAFLFWAVMAVAIALMLIEDAGDPRHRLREYVQFAFGETEGQGVMGTVTELLYFAVLAAIPLYALIRHGRVVLSDKRTKAFILVGFVAYALAGSLSFVGSAFSALLDRNFYDISGDLLYQLSVRLGDEGLLRAWTTISNEAVDAPTFIQFALMDSLVEESIELIGAAGFFAGTVAYLLAEFGHRREPGGAVAI
jgi:hypothetical protein